VHPTLAGHHQYSGLLQARIAMHHRVNNKNGIKIKISGIKVSVKIMTHQTVWWKQKGQVN